MPLFSKKTVGTEIYTVFLCHVGKKGQIMKHCCRWPWEPPLECHTQENPDDKGNPREGTARLLPPEREDPCHESQWTSGHIKPQLAAVGWEWVQENATQAPVCLHSFLQQETMRRAAGQAELNLVQTYLHLCFIILLFVLTYSLEWNHYLPAVKAWGVLRKLGNPVGKVRTCPRS